MALTRKVDKAAAAAIVMGIQEDLRLACEATEDLRGLLHEHDPLQGLLDRLEHGLWLQVTRTGMLRDEVRLHW